MFLEYFCVEPWESVYFVLKSKESVRKLQNRNASKQIHRLHILDEDANMFGMYILTVCIHHLTTVGIRISSSPGRMLMLEHSISQCCREQRCSGKQMHVRLWPSWHPAVSRIKLSSTMLRVLLVLSPSRWPLCLHLPCLQLNICQRPTLSTEDL